MMHPRNKFCSNALRLAFLVVYSITGKQYRTHQNNDIYITSEIALVKWEGIPVDYGAGKECDLSAKFVSAYCLNYDLK